MCLSDKDTFQRRPVVSLYRGYTIKELLEELTTLKIEASVDDWDGYGATAIPPSVFDNTERFINFLPSDVLKPEIVASPSGTIDFEWWFAKGKYFYVTIEDEFSVNYFYKTELLSAEGDFIFDQDNLKLLFKLLDDVINKYELEIQDKIS